MAARGRVDQLGGGAQPFARALHTAFDQVSCIEQAADLLSVCLAIAERER